jgi:hypothetical protein
LHPTSGPEAVTLRGATAGHPLSLFLSGMASELRRSGNYDEARRTAGRLLAFARLLVARNSNQPMALLALGEAYVSAPRRPGGLRTGPPSSGT